MSRQTKPLCSFCGGYDGGEEGSPPPFGECVIGHDDTQEGKEARQFLDGKCKVCQAFTINSDLEELWNKS